jgi:hypothetical protein
MKIMNFNWRQSGTRPIAEVFLEILLDECQNLGSRVEDLRYLLARIATISLGKLPQNLPHLPFLGSCKWRSHISDGITWFVAAV